MSRVLPGLSEGRTTLRRGTLGAEHFDTVLTTGTGNLQTVDLWIVLFLVLFLVSEAGLR